MNARIWQFQYSAFLAYFFLKSLSSLLHVSDTADHDESRHMPHFWCSKHLQDKVKHQEFFSSQRVQLFMIGLIKFTHVFYRYGPDHLVRQ